MEKQRQSEFSKSYKLKAGTVDRKAVRLHRRSVDWKNFRQDEVNKRRNIENLSPLKEISQNSSTINKSYKDKTPVKGGKPKENLKEKLKKWKEEKELKKKLEAMERAKKKPFKITHLIHNDAEVGTKNKPEKNRTLGGLSQSTGKNPPTHTSSMEKGTGKKTGQSTSTFAKSNSSFPRTTKSTTQASGKLIQSDQQSTKKEAPSNKFKQPVTSRVTRSSSRQTAAQKNQQEKATSHTRQGQTGKQAVSSQKKVAKQMTATPAQTLDKVTTRRHESFAPEEFSFVPPENLSSFVFQPLTPTSAREFLFSNNPDETASASFISNDPGRCSTPKRTQSKQEGSISEETNATKTNDRSKEKPRDTVRRSVRRSTRNTINSMADDDTNVSSHTMNSSVSRQTRSQKTSQNKKEDDASSKTEQQKEDTKQNVSTEKSTRSRSASAKRSRHISSPEKDENNQSKSQKRQRRSQTSETNETGESTGSAESGKFTQDGTPAKMVDGNETKVSECDGSTEKEEIASRSVIYKGDIDLQISVDFKKQTKKLNDAETPSGQQSVTLSGNNTNNDTINEESEKSDSDDVFISIPDQGPVTEKSTSKAVQDEALDNYMDLTPSRCTRAARRSLALLQSGKKEDTNRDTIETDVLLTLGKQEDTPGEKPNKKTKQFRKSIASTQPFVKPDSIVRSAKRNNKRRRRTECDGLFTPKSPEEWVKLLQNSPMIEMSRRTPKQKSPGGSTVPAFDLELDLDDLQLPPKESVKDEGDISQIINANLSISPHATEDGPSEATKEDSSKTSAPQEVTREDAESTEVIPPVSSVVEGDGDGPSEATKEDSSKTSAPQEVTQEDAESTEVIPPVSSVVEEKPSEVCDSSEGEHNVKYFRNLLKTETDRLNNLAQKWETINNETEQLTEEVRGQLRTVTGQAHLLITQRFKQFCGLVDNCEFGLGEKETTCTDLQGFWDMIYYQVEDVDVKFADLDKLKNNNWVIQKPEVKKVVKKKMAVSKPTVSKPVKSKFAAFRAQMKKSQNTEKSLVCTENPVRVFDAGFFKVASPVKERTPHCEAGSPKPKSSPQVAPSQEEPKGSEEKRQALLELPIESHQIRTPTRRSYVPVVPSPLLKDTTPLPRFTRSSLPRSLSQESSKETMEKEENVDKTDAKPAEPATTPSIIPDKKRRKSVRRSLRSRKSVSFCDTVSTVEISGTESDSPSTNDTDDMFQKYLEPANTRLSMAPKDFSIIDSCLGDGDNSFSSNAEDQMLHDSPSEKNSPNSRKRVHTNLKQLPSQKRRRSLRRSVTICSPVMEEKSDKSVFSPVQPVMTSDSSDMDDSNFSNLNIGYTPKSTSRRSRPSLLYTPPETSQLETSVSKNIPTGVLISFSP